LQGKNIIQPTLMSLGMRPQLKWKRIILHHGCKSATRVSSSKRVKRANIMISNKKQRESYDILRWYRKQNCMDSPANSV